MNKLSIAELSSLIIQDEAEYLDFKQEHHSNSAKLVHDILCLSNSAFPSNRYIIFGINDDKKIIGVNGKRKKQADIIDCLRNSNINDMPSLILYTEIIDNLSIDILQIQNSSNKPYFLLKDKKDGSHTVRAGVIYTRDKDVNTSVDKTASMSQIELMWRERFGIDKKPLEQFYEYLHDISGWEHQNDYEYYYSKNPDFKIEFKSDELRYDFHAYWIDFKHPCNLGSVEIFLTYKTTKIKRYSAINLEYKSYFQIPRYYDLDNVYDDGLSYVIKGHIVSYICAIISGTNDICAYETEFLEQNKLESSLDVYLYSLKIDFAIHSLKINIEEGNINDSYRFQDS